MAYQVFYLGHILETASIDKLSLRCSQFISDNSGGQENVQQVFKSGNKVHPL